MLVKHINASRFDVFYNTGWENWARFEIKDGHTYQVAGAATPKNILVFLAKRYNKS